MAGSFSVLSSCSVLRPLDNTKRNESETVIISNPADTLESEKNVPPEKSIEQEDITVEITRPIHEEAVAWVQYYEARYGKGSADEIIMSGHDIEEYNKKLISECTTLYDMTSPPETVDGAEVRGAIMKYSMPHGDKYDRHNTKIGEEKREKISGNRNLDNIPEKVAVRYGVVTQRCDMKAFPTEIGFYDGETGFYSSIQETELITGFPVLILHDSSDGLFYFVRSYYYSGWVSASCIATAERENYLEYLSPEKFVTVLEPEIKCENTILSMGSKLKYLSEDKEKFYVSVPARDEDGKLSFAEHSLDKRAACYGYLTYNMKNYYRQAFSYLGTMYGWGGDGGGVDCSGFVCAVFRTFGIYLPRNTGEQARYNGTVLSFENQSAAEILNGVKYPASVHRKGHVMLYLGEKDGIYYIIHAPQGGERVCVAPLSVPGNLTNVCLIK